MELTDTIASVKREQLKSLKNKKLKFSLLLYDLEVRITRVKLRKKFLILKFWQTSFYLKIKFPQKSEEKKKKIKLICQLIEKSNGKWCMFIKGAELLAS